MAEGTLPRFYMVREKIKQGLEGTGPLVTNGCIKDQMMNGMFHHKLILLASFRCLLFTEEEEARGKETK